MVNDDKPEPVAPIHDISVNTIDVFMKLVNQLTNYLAGLA
jgi:hypothetical protein